MVDVGDEGASRSIGPSHPHNPAIRRQALDLKPKPAELASFGNTRGTPSHHPPAADQRPPAPYAMPAQIPTTPFGGRSTVFARKTCVDGAGRRPYPSTKNNASLVSHPRRWQADAFSAPGGGQGLAHRHERDRPVAVLPRLAPYVGCPGRMRRTPRR